MNMLRKKLHEMTMNTDVSTHPVHLKQLSINYPNSIKVLKSEHQLSRYTCLMYALDFSEKEEYLEIAQFHPKIFAGEQFARWILDKKKLIEVDDSQATKGDLVFYFRESEWTHIGILDRCNRISSKWGSGQLYSHELFEVPENYGTIIRFFKSISYEDAYLYFTDYAAENGVEFT